MLVYVLTFTGRLHPFTERHIGGFLVALKRITMQDIADACSLSRNTVSKVFNDRGAVPEATRKLVLQKAQASENSPEKSEKNNAKKG